MVLYGLLPHLHSEALWVGLGCPEDSPFKEVNGVLQLSSQAVALLERARESQGIPEHFGVRVYGEPTPEGRTSIGIAFTETPEQGDQVAEQEGTKMFVAPEVAEPLSEAVLDTEESPDGLRLTLKSPPE